MDSIYVNNNNNSFIEDFFKADRLELLHEQRWCEPERPCSSEDVWVTSVITGLFCTRKDHYSLLIILMFSGVQKAI